MNLAIVTIDHSKSNVIRKALEDRLLCFTLLIVEDQQIGMLENSLSAERLLVCVPFTWSIVGIDSGEKEEIFELFVRNLFEFSTGGIKRFEVVRNTGKCLPCQSQGFVRRKAHEGNVLVVVPMQLALAISCAIVNAAGVGGLHLGANVAVLQWGVHEVGNVDRVRCDCSILRARERHGYESAAMNDFLERRHAPSDRLADRIERFREHDFADEAAGEDFQELLEELDRMRALEQFLEEQGDRFSGSNEADYEQAQEIRDLVAEMKLIPVREVIGDKRIVLCEDSIVRGTQLKNLTVQKLWENGAREVHVRPACPPLMYPCKFLLSTRHIAELAARKAIAALEGRDIEDVQAYLDESSPKYQSMVDWIQRDLNVTTLRYQGLDDMVEAIGLPRERLCLYCWNGRS